MAWWIWLTAAAGLMVAEVLTMSFFLACFGLGALVACAASALAAGATVQLTAFCLGSLVALVFLRPLLMRKRKGAPMNIDAYVGREAVALTPLRFGQAGGSVRVGGEIWSARLSRPGELPEGGMARVEAREGLVLLVAALPAGTEHTPTREDGEHD